jgi:4-coumarate--CoA ligase
MAPQNIYHSIYPNNHIPTDLSLHQFLLTYNPNDVLKDKVILEDLDPKGGKVTYGGLRRDAAIGAGALLKKFDLKSTDTVVIYAPNSVNYALLVYSVMWFGGIVV